MSGIPDIFGRDYRRAVFAAAAPGHACRLAIVLVDLAYTQRTTAVTAGKRQLQEETCLHDWRSFLRARDWLVAQGFLVYDPRRGGRGGSRSIYELVLPFDPEEAGAEVGAYTHPLPNEEVSAEAGAEVGADPGAQAGAHAHPRSSPGPVLDGGERELNDDKRLEFDALIGRLERLDKALMTGPGRRSVLDAWQGTPEGVAALVHRLERSRLDSRLGALVAAVRRGEHREAAAALELAKPDPERWFATIGVGYAHDRVTFHEEARHGGVQLSSDELEARRLALLTPSPSAGEQALLAEVDELVAQGVLVAIDDPDDVETVRE